MTPIAERALHLLVNRGFASQDVSAILSALEQAGFRLAEPGAGGFVCHWVNVLNRSVPAHADTIIRTVTRTAGAQVASSTHWLEGLEPPPAPELPAR